MRTAWVVPRALLGDEFLEATFPRPILVSGVVVRLRRDSVFPTRFRVGGRVAGRWTELARFDAGHALLGAMKMPGRPAREVLVLQCF